MFGKIKYFLRRPLQLIVVPVVRIFPGLKFIRETQDYQGFVNFEFWFTQKVLNIGGNRKAYWPVHFTSKVYDVEKIDVGIDAYPGIMGGCYITGRGGLTIGDYTQIAPNVAIVTANHDPYDSRKHILKPVAIGKYCWLGAGCKIMPGVVLGDWTVVAAGAVVTKSFPEGFCILGGVPAVKIRDLDKEKCVPFENKHKYRGYIKAEHFEKFKGKYLNL
ncbi:acyltransferase [Flavihumibacter petaseus]|uniref:Putative acetyltransferase n=1 Tax=Flavihumibacter petaseus NBRC 106054 TaxID=1220578 RepID=A0A0E9N796_9BACT|nr:acyltransferase [Flavihumibacter petaseus]GAO45220.1 putative acetyltransferase [Flavihumibacter petaseus NBRC 106054]